MHIKFQPQIVKPSWINRQKLVYVKGYSETLKKQVSGLIPTSKVRLLVVVNSAKESHRTLVLDRIPSTRMKDKYLFNATK